ncbi:MAG TPA: PEP-CTERM sorting domain-containing protein, partial [Gemmataceae bacterium]
TGQTIGVNQITTSVGGGTIDFTGAGADTLAFEGASPAITVNGDSTWLSPANATTIANPTFSEVLITIHPGVTLTNGIALKSVLSGFRITGGGTLFQNADATNAANMSGSVTISQGRFRVTDVTSNGGLGNLGPVGRDLVLDGGTFAYGGPTAATAKAIDSTLNSGAVEVESAAATLTLTGAVFGPGGLTKTGPGTLAFATVFNSLSGITVNAGTVQAANDAALGPGPVTVGPAGTLNYVAGTATARRIDLVFGTLTVAAGATLTLQNGAAVNGGFARGGYVVNGASLTGVTTASSATVNVTGPGSFTNFTNGGALTVAAGVAGPVTFNLFTNQGSGSITIGTSSGAGSTVSASDFQTSGVVTIPNAPGGFNNPNQLANVGTSPLSFNGGSRTFLGTPASAGQLGAVVDLGGRNAVVAGGLLVNNGLIYDSTGGGTATLIADFGALIKGGGTYGVPVVTVNGGRFQAGNSPGKAEFGSVAFGPGGVSGYLLAMNDADGTAGPTPDADGHVSGWGLIKAVRQVGPTDTSGDFVWTADPAHKLSVAIDTLVNPTTAGADVPGSMDHFDPTRSYAWPAVTWAGTYTGPADAAALDAATAFDTTGFLNPTNGGSFGWALDAGGHTLSLTFTPVPEPTTLALLGATAAGWAAYRRRKSRVRV